MYTEVSKYLGEFLEHTRKCDLTAHRKAQVVAALEYFHIQSLCDNDRRDNQTLLRKRWADLENTLHHTNLLGHFKKEESKWIAIENFIGSSTVHLKLASSKPVKDNKWAKAEAPDFFEFLARASEEKGMLNEAEVLALRFGLYYLELEAKRTRYQRDKSRIRFAWLHVQPLLIKANLIQQFYSERDLIRRVKSFVSDSIL